MRHQSVVQEYDISTWRFGKNEDVLLRLILDQLCRHDNIHVVCSVGRKLFYLKFSFTIIVKGDWLGQVEGVWQMKQFCKKHHFSFDGLQKTDYMHL